MVECGNFLGIEWDYIVDSEDVARQVNCGGQPCSFFCADAGECSVINSWLILHCLVLRRPVGGELSPHGKESVDAVGRLGKVVIRR